MGLALDRSSLNREISKVGRSVTRLEYKGQRIRHVGNYVDGRGTQGYRSRAGAVHEARVCKLTKCCWISKYVLDKERRHSP